MIRLLFRLAAWFNRGYIFYDRSCDRYVDLFDLL